MPGLTFETVIGSCRVEWEGDQLVSFRLPPATPSPADPALTDAPALALTLIERVKRHLAGDLQDFSDTPIDFTRVSSFQRAVYEAALRVKPGQTRTYGWIAEQIGQPVAVSRAVGTALGQNPWPLLVPCHRFIGANGKMVGFSAPGGIQTKLRLLAIEGAELAL